MRTVFFDLDDTLIRGNSANLFIKYMLKRRELGWADVAKGFYYTLQYKLNCIDIEQVTSSFIKRYEGTLESTLLEHSDDFFDTMVRPVIYDDARTLVDEHRNKGDKLILLTAATIYACMPVTKHLGFDHYIGTKLTVVDGKLTGHIEPPLCYGPGKVTHAKQFLETLAGPNSLSEATFYTDSITDLPMLLAVGDPQVVNPDRLLAREAKRRGWPVRNFLR